MTRIIQAPTIPGMLDDLTRRIRNLEMQNLTGLVVAAPSSPTMVRAATTGNLGTSGALAFSLSETAITSTQATFTLAGSSSIIVMGDASFSGTGGTATQANLILQVYAQSGGAEQARGTPAYWASAVGSPNNASRHIDVSLAGGNWGARFLYVFLNGATTTFTLNNARIDVYIASGG